ncbi:hypothetical protein QE360_002035 [Sphingomonas sp. SORGH_AS789]|nr:hypothetical protein [Sphingomonas sp. SORGH_AS_0789]MDR6151260.1 hypothetical protein [Sphingomonas sp. SORGH_AS_0742]
MRRHHLGLAVQRQVVVELGDDDVRQRGEGRLAAYHGGDRRRRLDDLVAYPAAVFWADVAHDPPTDWHDVEHLVRVRPERPQRTAAVRTGAGARQRLVDDLLARQISGQAANGHRSCHYAAVGPLGYRRITLRFQFLQRQFELLDLAAELLGRRAELHPSQPRDLSAQGVDEQVAGGECGIGPGERGLQRGDPRDGISRGNGRFRHPVPIADCMSASEGKWRKTAVPTPPASG